MFIKKIIVLKLPKNNDLYIEINHVYHVLMLGEFVKKRYFIHFFVNFELK